MADEDDERDMLAIAELSPGVIAPEARIGLMRMNSKTESSYSDFFSHGDFNSPASPTSPFVFEGVPSQKFSKMKEAEESQELDPEKHNIRQYYKHTEQSH